MSGYNQLCDTTIEKSIRRIKNGNFRYCPMRSAGCWHKSRWPEYSNSMRVGEKVARRSAIGVDCEGPWIKVAMGNIITISPRGYNTDQCTEEFKKYNPLYSDEGLKINILGSVFDIFGFKFVKVRPYDKKTYFQWRTADYSKFIVKFYIDRSIEDMFRNVKRNSYNPAKLSRDDLIYKKYEAGDYFIDIEPHSNKKVYFGRIWSSGGGWFYNNFLDEKRTRRSKPFQTRKKARESLYQELRA